MYDAEEGVSSPNSGNKIISNPTYKYFQTEEKLHGFLSQQFPTIANPAPLGLSAFALTTFTLSMYNTGALGPIVSLRAGSQGEKNITWKA